MDINLTILITSVILGISTSYLGSLILSRRMTLVADPLSHLALPGALIGLIFGFDVSLSAFIFLIFSAFIIWYLEKFTKLSIETIIAILFSSSLAFTFLFIEEEKIHEILIGDIFKINFSEAVIVIVISLILLIVLVFTYDKLLLISISEELAYSEKINVRKYQSIYLISLSLLVALGIKFVGGLLISGLIALPAASARNLSNNLKNYKLLSLFFGFFSSFTGVIICYSLNITSGAVIVIVNFLIFLITLILKNR